MRSLTFASQVFIGEFEEASDFVHAVKKLEEQT